MSDVTCETLPAAPKYPVGELVHYRDREGRSQTGRVRWIEAKWYDWGHGPIDPLIIYALYHPTYRNNNFYCGDEDIQRAASEREKAGFRYD